MNMCCSPPRRSNTRLSDANAKLLNERHRTKALFSSSLGPPQLDMSCLGGSPTGYGASLGGPLNRSLGLGGLPLLSPMSEGHNSSVEDYLARVSNTSNTHRHARTFVHMHTDQESGHHSVYFSYFTILILSYFDQVNSIVYTVQYSIYFGAAT